MATQGEGESEFLRRVRERWEQFLRTCVRIDAPEGKQVNGPCIVPRSRIDGDEIINTYVAVRFERGRIMAHQLAVLLKPGVAEGDPGKLMILHKCDRKCCVNQDHLEIGDASKNSQDALKRGLIPKRKFPGMKGEDNPKAKLSKPEIAEIRWLLENEEKWMGLIVTGHSAEDAVAIHYGVSRKNLRLIQKYESWREVKPKRPRELPSAQTVPANSTPPLPTPIEKIGLATAKWIVKSFHESEDKRRFVARVARDLDVVIQSIHAILKGKIYKEASEGYPLPSFDVRPRLTDEKVRQIRATAAAFSEIKGLRAVLGRHFGISPAYLALILARVMYCDVEDDPKAVIPLALLKFLPLTPIGSAHPLAKLTEEKVFEILVRLGKGAKVMDLAREYRVTITVIYGIRKGKTWKHVWRRFNGGQHEH